MATLDKNRALITAGASGIGYAMAEVFTETKASVWVTDVDPNAISGCPNSWGTREVDAADERRMKELFGEIESTWGDSIPYVQMPTLPDQPPRSNTSSSRIGNMAVFLASKYAIPMMKQLRAGAIVITSSTAGFTGYPQRAPYVAAKWAVIGLAKTLAMELGPHNIRTNAICPGPIDGARMDGVIKREAAVKRVSKEAIRKGYASGTSMGTFLRPSETRNMAVFLASSQARYVSGQVIAVDGYTFNPDPRV